jgi:signal transduction histidine kinase
VRAEALLGLARAQASLGRADDALAAFAAVRDPDVLLDGRPAELLARLSRCTLLKELGRQAQLIEDARQLSRDLHGGRWPLTRAAYLHYAGEVRHLSEAGAAVETGPDPRAVTLAESVQRLWEEWQDARTAAGPTAGRTTRVVNTRTVFQIWRGTPDRFIALVGGTRFLEDRITAPIRSMLDAQGIQLALTDDLGRTVLSHGDRSVAPSHDAVRAADAKLPWTLQTGRVTPAADSSRFTSMPQLLIALLVFLGLFVMTGTYFSVRAMTREMEAVRLKSEFVAAVSHEFRTPLTLLRQFSDLLAEDRVTSDQERRRYYAALQRGTRRLTRLVEDLLDFGRMEAGSRAFPLEPVLAHDLVATLIAEFQDEYRSKGYTVETSWQAPLGVVIQADPAAVGRAVWNLLDNAVKYSPACRTIWVATSFANDQWRIEVRDRGIGIPPDEQRTVFRKFVRGADRDGHRISGTGLGLALVEQIVEAHGGRVELESAVGAGSTFAIILPATLAAHVREHPQWRAS